MIGKYGLLVLIIVVVDNLKLMKKLIKCCATYNKAKQDVIKAHENLFDYVEKKMQKLRLGLKAYNFFDQAKKLADNLGIPLNESVLNESSSMALSVYNPDNLSESFRG